MFLSEKREVALENLKTFYQKGFGTHFQAIAVKLEGRLFYARSKGLQRNGSYYGEYLRIADEYWSQPQDSNDGVKEILFEGKAEPYHRLIDLLLTSYQEICDHRFL